MKSIFSVGPRPAGRSAGGKAGSSFPKARVVRRFQRADRVMTKRFDSLPAVFKPNLVNHSVTLVSCGIERCELWIGSIAKENTV